MEMVAVYVERERIILLEDHALPVLLSSGAARHERSPSSMLEYLADALAGPGGALQVLVGADLLADLLTLHITLSAHRHSKASAAGQIGEGF